jgi:hypothetical protein
MGYRWVLSGKVNVGRKALDAYKKTVVNPARYTDWPESWGEPGCSAGPMTIAEVVKTYEHTDAHDVRWDDGGVTLRALFSNDHDAWLTFRSHFAAAVRMAADFKGTADVAITGYVDGGPSDVYRILAHADGTSEMEVLTARAAKPIASRVHADVEPLVEAMLARYRPKGPTPADIPAVNARVCAALRTFAPDAVMAAARRETTTFIHPKKKVKNVFLDGGTPLHELFPHRDELIDALENGWDDKSPLRSTDKLPLVALRILARLARAPARELAKAYLEIKTEKAKSPLVLQRSPLETLQAEAEVILGSVEGPKEVAAAIAAMRKALPSTPNANLRPMVRELAVVRILRESQSPEVYKQVRAELVELTEADRKGPLKQLSAKAQIYAYALTLALEPMATGADLQMLFRLWTDSKGFQLLDHYRILKHGDVGKAYMASLFGRRTTSHYDTQEQGLAAVALLDTDEKAALAAARAQLGEKTLTTLQVSGLHSLFQELAERKASKAWTPTVLDATRKGIPAYVAEQAVRALAAWKHPSAAARILEHIDAIGLDDSCRLLEIADDPAALPALEARLAALASRDRRSKNRIEQYIAHLQRKKRSKTAK